MRRASSALLICSAMVLAACWTAEASARGGGRGGGGVARGPGVRAVALGRPAFPGGYRLRSGIGYGESPVFGYGPSPTFGYGTGYRGGYRRFGNGSGFGRFAGRNGRDRFGDGYGYGGYGYGSSGYGYGGYGQGGYGRSAPEGFGGSGGVAGIPAPRVAPPAVYVVGRSSRHVVAGSVRSSSRGSAAVVAESRDAGRESGVVSAGARVIRVSGVR